MRFRMALPVEAGNNRRPIFRMCDVIFPVLRKAAAAQGVHIITPGPNEPYGGGGAVEETSGLFYGTTYTMFQSPPPDQGWEEASAWLRAAFEQMPPEVQLVLIRQMKVGG